MRHFHRRTLWRENSRMDFKHDCCKEFVFGENYGYAPWYFGHYPFHQPYGFDREMEKEFLELRLKNIQEQEKYIKERLKRLDELEEKENPDKQDNNN